MKHSLERRWQRLALPGAVLVILLLIFGCANRASSDLRGAPDWVVVGTYRLFRVQGDEWIPVSDGHIVLEPLHRNAPQTYEGELWETEPWGSDMARGRVRTSARLVLRVGESGASSSVVIKLASGIDATLGGFAGLIRRGTNPRWPRQVVGVFFPAGTLADADEVWTLRVAIELQGHTGSLTLHRSTRGEGVLPPGEHGTDALLFNASVVDPYLEQQTLRTLAAEGQDIPEIIAYLLESEVDYLVLYGISVLDRHLASDLHQKMSPHLEERLEEIAADETRSKTVQTLAADYLKRGSR